MTLAARYGGAIVSADSRQIYCGFDIGTAKPSRADRERIPHYGIDVAAPHERVSAGWWAAHAWQWIAAARAAGRVPLVVGGTGFYVRALVRPLFAEPALDPRRRAALAALLAGWDTAALRRWVERVDPGRARLGRTQLLRAIEMATLTGTSISAWHQRAERAPGGAVRYLVLDPNVAMLHERIALRLDSMMTNGWGAETARLIRTVPSDAPAWQATGYEIMRAVARGEIEGDEGRGRIARATRQYAKRQRTWFRHQLTEGQITRIDPDAPGAWERAAAWWERESDTP